MAHIQMVVIASDRRERGNPSSLPQCERHMSTCADHAAYDVRFRQMWASAADASRLKSPRPFAPRDDGLSAEMILLARPIIKKRRFYEPPFIKHETDFYCQELRIFFM
jgi:hypothetical protein